MEASTQERQEEQTDERRDGDGKAGNVGRIEEITGVVIEASFEGDLPDIYSALEVDVPIEGEGVAGEEAQPESGSGDSSNGSGDGDRDGGASRSRRLICEVQQHLGDDRVRAVAMDSTDGLSRGAEVRDTGGPITVPVGDVTLGRIFNLLGDPIDQGDEVEAVERWPIHRPVPQVEDLTPSREIFETGI